MLPQWQDVTILRTNLDRVGNALAGDSLLDQETRTTPMKRTVLGCGWLTDASEENGCKFRRMVGILMEEVDWGGLYGRHVVKLVEPSGLSE